MGPELIIPLVGALLGGVGSLFGTSDKSEKMTEIVNKIQEMLPDILQGGLGTSALLDYATRAKQNLAGAGDVAAAGLAPAVSERNYAAGVPEGQPSTSLYVSEVAPVKARGIQIGEQSFLDMLARIEQLDSQRKAQALQALGLSLEGAGSTSDLNDFGRALGGILQGANLGATALGNYGQYQYWINKT